jgi:hypothetical protein
VKIEEIHSDSDDEDTKGPAEAKEEDQQRLEVRQAERRLQEGVEAACRAKELMKVVEDAFR